MLLEGVDCFCKNRMEDLLHQTWVEGSRSFKFDCHSNGAGCPYLILLSLYWESISP